MHMTFILIFGVLGYFTFTSARQFVQSDWQEPMPINEVTQQYRLVLITQDIDTPFWNEVAVGAHAQANLDDVIIEVLGNYGRNEEVFLRNLELAIYAKVDGIIVQGLDTDEFKELTKIKAAFYGIPIITIAHDVAMEESLRRTYVGSPQYEAGQLIAQQLVSDMGEQGEVILFANEKNHSFQQERGAGIESVLAQYANITVIKAETTDVREDILATTQQLLNDYPQIKGFISIDANLTAGLIQEISRRRQVDSLYIYSFDDHADIQPLLSQKRINAVIAQDPVAMGRTSVQVMIEWLKGETVPLDSEGYFTDISILKAVDES